MPIKWDLYRRIVIQNLVVGASKNEIEQLFRKFGHSNHERRINKLWIARNPPGLAFLEYRHRRDAEEAARELNGKRCCGYPITVELSVDSKQASKLSRCRNFQHTARYASTRNSEHPRRKQSSTKSRHELPKDIEQAETSAVCRRRSDNQKDQFVICNICYENALKREPTATICGHIFCSFCIREALKLRRKCPFCVTSIRENNLIPLFVSV